MRLDRFDLNLLVIFEAVYAQGNLTRAAENLNMAQPTVSNALARLRAAFDDPLFVRAGRGVAPTPLATRMIGPVRHSLRQMQATLDGNIAFDPGTSDRRFCISIGEIHAASLLPQLLEMLGREAPSVTISAFQTDRKKIKGALALGELDLAVDIANLSSNALCQHPLARGGYVCLVRKGHPAARGKLTLKRFLSLEFIAVSSRPEGSSLLDLALSRAGSRVEPVLRTQHYLPAFRIIESSDYALIAPRTLVEPFGLIARELPFDTQPEGVSLYWHRTTDEDPANRWLHGLVIRGGGEAASGEMVVNGR